MIIKYVSIFLFSELNNEFMDFDKKTTLFLFKIYLFREFYMHDTTVK